MTLDVDYEQSQAHHEIHVLWEAELTEQEHNEAVLHRHQKHQQLGNLPSTSPPKDKSHNHDEMVRSTAQEAHHTIGYVFRASNFQNYKLVDVPIELGLKWESQSQEVASLDPSQDHESDHDSDHELPVQVVRLKNRLNIALRECDDLEDQCNQYQQAYIQADTERSQLREELQRWEQAPYQCTSVNYKVDLGKSNKFKSFKALRYGTGDWVPATDWLIGWHSHYLVLHLVGGWRDENIVSKGPLEPRISVSHYLLLRTQQIQ
ncbi:hypothetical protein DFH08DRAFT_820313 [Mycena albidolilacea]|uniref:Uncharacterized protein n=1 Tax=Mycena albidolilacea TaxID=1033008 RepID=A0AAD6ZD23_9AGAR|nr:hypothetical protein DFH08DRAFT_820313 [Mycena albidolilacea]